MDGLLDPATDLVDGGRSEPGDVERVEYRAGVVKVVIDRVLVAMERVQGSDLDTSGEGFAALVQPVAVGLPGTAWDKVQQRARGVPSGAGVRSTMPVNSLGPRPP